MFPIPNADEILEFWFADCEQSGDALRRQRARWYKPDPNFDAEICNRFEALLHAAARGDLAQWELVPSSRLALIVLLDQFPRNIYRGGAEAFAYDQYASQQCLELRDTGGDQQLSRIQRVFAYMPLQHSEELALQERSVQLFTELAQTAPPELRGYLNGSREYAVEHRDIVARFGRFPHRNAALSRDSDPEELAYLSSGGKTFGQS